MSNIYDEIEQKRELLNQVKTFVEGVAEANKHTPDISSISRRKGHIIFLYDCLMGCHNKLENLDNSLYKAIGFTKDRFQLWDCENDQYRWQVMLKKDASREECLPIKGELWELPTQELIDLDFVFENGVVFDRVRLDIRVPYRRVVHHKEPVEFATGDAKGRARVQVTTNNIPQEFTIPAWTYVGRTDFWKDRLDGGYTTRLIKKFRSNRDYNYRYYFHSPVEVKS